MRAPRWRMAVGVVAGVVAGAGATAGCLPGPEDFDTRVSEICVHTLVPFEGGAGQGVTTEVSLADAVRGIDELGSGAAITLDWLRLTPGPGIADFGFVQGVEIDLAAEGAPTLRLLEVADVAGSAPVELSGEASGAPDADLRPYLDSEEPALGVTFLGEVPATPWSVTLDACLAVHDAPLATP
jgi:hypothetical protein